MGKQKTIAASENQGHAATCGTSPGPDCSAPHGLCNCPNCATNNCPNADDTRLHGAAVALMGLLDAFEHDGGDTEQLLFLAQTWREQERIKGEQNPRFRLAAMINHKLED